MDEAIDAADLAMLTESFAAVMTEAPGAGAADARLHELGWGDLLAVAPTRGAAAAFTVLGTTGSAAALLDDVVAHALGLPVSPTTCVALPAPQQSTPPGRRVGSVVLIDGLVSARLDRAADVFVAIAPDGAATGGPAADVVSVDAHLLEAAPARGVDPAGAYRRVSGELRADQVSAAPVEREWQVAVVAARAALAHQLIASARTMLADACQHAVDRSQFGRPVASFQAVRHKLAETLVDIEAAASVASAVTDGADPLLAALAKSLAGKASRTASRNAQQVLAGIGFTTDHRFQLWMKRALVIDTLFGSAGSLPTEIGQELLRRGGAPRLLEL